jgi:hypothetical protein
MERSQKKSWNQQKIATNGEGTYWENVNIIISNCEHTIPRKKATNSKQPNTVIEAYFPFIKRCILETSSRTYCTLQQNLSC